MFATALAVAAACCGAAADDGYRFARSLAAAGPRPAASRAERRALDRVAARFRGAGLEVRRDGFSVPGKGRSGNVTGIRETPSRCLVVLIAHADSAPGAPGANDNASGLGALVALARVLPARPTCDVWLVATGAEERVYTRQPDHLGALALVRRLRRERRAGDVRLALALDEVGRGPFWLRSPAARPRAGVERAVLDAARRAGVAVRWVRDAGTGNSDHRELALAGMPAAKLGVSSDRCRHTPCDTSSRISRPAFDRTLRILVRLRGLSP